MIKINNPYNIEITPELEAYIEAYKYALSVRKRNNKILSECAKNARSKADNIFSDIMKTRSNK